MEVINRYLICVAIKFVGELSRMKLIRSNIIYNYIIKELLLCKVIENITPDDVSLICDIFIATRY